MVCKAVKEGGEEERGERGEREEEEGEDSEEKSSKEVTLSTLTFLPPTPLDWFVLLVDKEKMQRSENVPDLIGLSEKPSANGNRY